MHQLGTMVVDRVTCLKGMLTHLQIEGNTEMYLFQPSGLNPETCEPVETFWIDPARVQSSNKVAEPYLARDVLGTEVEDTATGFKGIAVATILHINGCLHLDVQPSGYVEKTGKKIARHNFDIRRLKGKAIVPQSEVEYELSKVSTPSPDPMPRLRD